MRSISTKKCNSFRSMMVLIACLCAACSGELDQKPTTIITDANFWKSTSDLALACNYLYSYLPGHNQASTNVTYYQAAPFQDFYADDFFGNGANSVSNGTQLVPASSPEWTGYYKLIAAANNIIQKAPLVQGDSAAVNKYIGEARFFRGFAYFELVKRFGDVPLILKTLTESDPELLTPRTDRQVVYEQIYADLTYAAAKCPAPDKLPSAEYGRITSTAALGLLSRAGLFEGTRQKYHQYGSPEKHLTIALNAAKAVIEGGKHSLYTNAASADSSYYYLFQYQAQGTSRLAAGTPTSIGSYAVNKEGILPKLYFGGGGINVLSQFISNSLVNRNYKATKHLIDQYLYSDGLPKSKSPLVKPKELNTLTEFQNRDPRLGMMINNKNSYNPTPSSGGGTWLLNVFYVPRKWLHYVDNANNGGFINFYTIRYAEVLLNYAELLYELNGCVSDAELDLTVNAIRNRASGNSPQKLALLTNSFAQARGLNVRDEIRREREIELAMEGFRYWDLIRWKTAETELPKDVLGPRIFPAELQKGTAIPPLNADSVSIYERGRKFDPARDYLWPIPTREIGLSGGIYTQNPNW
jgi:hypothetical protein